MKFKTLGTPLSTPTKAEHQVCSIGFKWILISIGNIHLVIPIFIL